MSTPTERAEAEVKRWSDLLEAALIKDEVNVDQIALFERYLKEANERLKEANAIQLASISQQQAAAPVGN